MYKAEATTNAGATPEKARKRGAEVHQAGLHLVLEAIRELCAPTPYRFANGEVYTRYWIEAQENVGDSESLRPLDSGRLVVW